MSKKNRNREDVVQDLIDNATMLNVETAKAEPDNEILAEIVSKRDQLIKEINKIDAK
jgi:hypothetical protein